MLKAEKRNFAKTFTLELYACEFCELCVQVCPTDAIIMMKSFDMATADRRELLLDKDRLHRSGSSSSRRGRPATCCATCRRRPRPAEEPEQAAKAGRRADEPRADRLLGARGGAARLGPRGGADQEPLPLGALPGAGADRDRRASSCRSTRSSSPPSSSCSTRAASSPSWSSPSWSPSGWWATASPRPAGRSRPASARGGPAGGDPRDLPPGPAHGAAARGLGRPDPRDRAEPAHHATCCPSSCWRCCSWPPWWARSTSRGRTTSP